MEIEHLRKTYGTLIEGTAPMRDGVTFAGVSEAAMAPGTLRGFGGTTETMKEIIGCCLGLQL